MNRNAVTTLLCIVAILTGCSDAGNIEADFISALNSDEGKHLCIRQGDLGVTIWGTEDGDQYLIYNGVGSTAIKEGKRMLSKFVEKGYVNPDPISIKYNFSQHNAYELNDKGHQYFKWGKRVCIGDRIATSIIEYTEPAENSGMTITQVKFAYDIELDKFVHDLELEEALQKDGKMDTEGQALFVKTNKGWRLENGW